MSAHLSSDELDFYDRFPWDGTDASVDRAGATHAHLECCWRCRRRLKALIRRPESGTR